MAGMICPQCLQRMRDVCAHHEGPYCARCQTCYCPDRESGPSVDVFEQTLVDLYKEDPEFWQSIRAVPCHLDGDRMFCRYIPTDLPVAELRRRIAERWLIRNVFLKPATTIPLLSTGIPLYIAAAGKPGAGWLIPLTGKPEPWPDRLQVSAVRITPEWHEIPWPVRITDAWRSLIREHACLRIYTPPFPVALTRAVLAADPESIWLWYGPYGLVAAHVGLPVVPVTYPWTGTRLIRWRNPGCVQIRSPRHRPAATAVATVRPQQTGDQLWIAVDVQYVRRTP